MDSKRVQVVQGLCVLALSLFAGACSGGGGGGGFTGDEDSGAEEDDKGDGDEDSGGGGDTTPPIITDIFVQVDNTGRALVTWTTDEPATTVVDYGLTSSYGSNQTSTSLVTNHAVILQNLVLESTYHFRVTSADAAGNTAAEPDATFFSGTSADTTAPTISNVQVTVDNLGGATVTWDTDESATSRVDFGTTQSYGQSRGRPGTRDVPRHRAHGPESRDALSLPSLEQRRGR